MSATLLGLLALGVVLGVLAIAGGLALLARSRAEPIPEHTGPAERQEVIERAVYLAVELARSDGAIEEAEMAAIEAHCVQRLGLDPEASADLLRRMLRATQHRSGARQALGDIARLADRPLRREVVALLEAVAGSAEASPVRAAWMGRVRRRLGS